MTIKEELVEIVIVLVLTAIEIGIAFLTIKGFGLPPEMILLLGSVAVFIGKKIKKKITD